MGGYGPWTGSEFPKSAAEVAMALVGPVLEERDAEIARLEAELRDARSGEDLSAL